MFRITSQERGAVSRRASAFACLLSDRHFIYNITHYTLCERLFRGLLASEAFTGKQASCSSEASRLWCQKRVGSSTALRIVSRRRASIRRQTNTLLCKHAMCHSRAASWSEKPGNPASLPCGRRQRDVIFFSPSPPFFLAETAVCLGTGSRYTCVHRMIVFTVAKMLRIHRDLLYLSETQSRSSDESLPKG